MTDSSTSTSLVPLVLGERKLCLQDVVDVARHGRLVKLSAGAQKRIALSRVVVDTLMARKVKIYGLTTGFASLRDRLIDPSEAEALSENLIRSHSAGVGAPFDEDVVRAAMLVRAQALSLGRSGVRLEFVQTVLDMLNTGVYPYVPEQGSVGSSGDLAPLSHLFLVAIGDPDGKVHRRILDKNTGKSVSSIRASRDEDFIALRDLGITALPFKPIRLGAKEGLAANNGAVFSAVVTALAVFDCDRAVNNSELITALSYEALNAVPDCLDEEITASRPHVGHRDSAENIKAALRGSKIALDYGACGFNMARYNRSLIRLRELRSTVTSKDQTLVDSLWQSMSDYQEGIPAALEKTRQQMFAEQSERHPAKEIELAACEKVFAPIRKLWEEFLGWSDSANEVTVALRKSLSVIYHQQVSKIVRPDSNPDVQDNYSFRASPTVIGAARDTLEYARQVVEIEINSATDNPLILLDRILKAFADESEGVGLDDPENIAETVSVDEFSRWAEKRWTLCANNVKSAANFHGEPVGLAADYLAVALAEIGSISERRLATLIDSNHSKGLPPYLVWNPGLQSGLMMVQYTAAALVSENKTLAVPASVDSIPTGEGCEDHNSMSSIASRQLAKVVTNTERILAAELLGAYQGVQFRQPTKLGQRTAQLERRVAEALEKPLTESSGWSSLTEMRSALRELGLAETTAEQVSPCLVDDIPPYRLLGALVTLMQEGLER